MTITMGWLPALLLAAAASVAGAPSIEKPTVRHGSTEVPVEIARPTGSGPWPPVLYIHAKRGDEEVDREHLRALARDGFLVMAPDWFAANMIERWPDRHVPEIEDDVEAALAALLAHPDACRLPPAACRLPLGVMAKSLGPYFAIRLAAKRAHDVDPIVAQYGHFQNPNAPEPQQLFSVAPEVRQVRSPVLMLIGHADLELRRHVNGRAFYVLWERGVPVELQMYPLARRAFDFRTDQSPEEKVAARDADGREREWLRRWMGLGLGGGCPRPSPGR